MDQSPTHDPYHDRQPGAYADPPQSQARVVHCTQCGVGLNGLSIGSPCPNCSVPVGTGPAAQRRTSGKAVAALVLGICSIVGCLFCGIPGLVCGILAIVFARDVRRKVQEGKLPPTALDMANPGRVCGIIGTSLSILAIVLIIAYMIFIFAFLMPTMQQQQQMNQYQQTNPYQVAPNQPQPSPPPAGHGNP